MTTEQQRMRLVTIMCRLVAFTRFIEPHSQGACCYRRTKGHYTHFIEYTMKNCSPNVLLAYCSNPLPFDRSSSLLPQFRLHSGCRCLILCFKKLLNYWIFYVFLFFLPTRNNFYSTHFLSALAFYILPLSTKAWVPLLWQHFHNI